MAYFARANLRNNSRSVHFAVTKTGLFDKSTLTRTALPTPYFDIGWGAEQERRAVAGERAAPFEWLIYRVTPHLSCNDVVKARAVQSDTEM